MRLNPFIYGRSLTPAEFFGRKRALRHLFGRLVMGQSTAIIGQPYIGKTSLLNYVADKQARRRVVGQRFEKDIFSFVDGQMLHGIESQAEFWEYALQPLSQKLAALPSKSLPNLYHRTQQNNFETYLLEHLFRQLYQETGARVILLIDEFDALLSHPVFHCAEFYGGLRSLASRAAGLVLVIAVRRDLSQLNQLTQDINPHGSPYFNTFTEYHLGVLDNREAATILRHAGSFFKHEDRRFVWEMSGRQPYLLQVSCAMLWDADTEGLTGEKRYRMAGEFLYRETAKHFTDSWRMWSNETRKAVTAVALVQMPDLARGRRFRVGELATHLDDFTPELDRLATSGFVKRNDQGRWVITQYVFLWWLADELWRNVRDDSDFTIWLQRQTMDGVLTRGQRERMGEAVRTMLSFVEKGASTFIESYARSLVG